MEAQLDVDDVVSLLRHFRTGAVWPDWGSRGSQVIHDCLDQYERHVEFLRLTGG